MRNTLCLVAVGIICALATGCNDPYEDVVKEQMSLLKEVNVILATVKDDASLKGAKPALEELGLKMKDAAERLKDLEPPSKDREVSLKAKYEKKTRAAVTELLTHLTKIGTMEGGAEEAYNQDDATGFIALNALRLKASARQGKDA